MNLRKELFDLQDLNYKEFASKLTRTRYPIIGVRIPFLKKIAKEIKGREISFNYNDRYFEEVMIEGILIGYLNDVDLVINKLDSFISLIDDWSVCDSVCANLKITKKNKEKMWEFITKFINSDKEFEVRFMVVMMMDYYLEDEYIEKIFNILDNIKIDFYYSNMAVSWLLATSVVKCEKKTIEYLRDCTLSDFVYNKAISKACESYRVSDELKQILKKMKR